MAACLPAAPVLTLLPPDLVNSPGSTSGWGFTITNDTNYIEVTSAQFCLNPQSFPACTASTLGVFQDFISGFNNIIVGPLAGTLPASVTQIFNLAANTGIGSFAFGLLAPSQVQEFGSIVLTYNITDLDPNDPNANFLGSGTLSASASLTSVPEPSTAALLCGALLLGWRLRRKDR
ncbi:MAG: PEP-CTERM sorting domain-containing protein [Bryobacteraceae bacterium]|nr:PEP-CTERM sorting domain-containing protein [Bryobacteraceae bacterium]